MVALHLVAVTGSAKTLVSIVLGSVLVMSFWACDQGKEGLVRLSDGALAINQGEAAGASRAALVAQADRLALEAERSSGAKAVRLLTRAGELRHSSYLLEGRDVDALEAIELYSDAAARTEGESCDLGLELAELRAHVSGDAQRHYRDLYILRQRQPALACRKRLDRGLAVLDAYRPSEAELAKLRDGVAERNSDEHHDGQALQSPDVVVPKLEAGLNEPTQITRIERFGAERTARVVIHVTHPTRFEVGAIPARDGKGPRFFVDIQHASYDEQQSFDMGGLVERVRLGQQDDATRVVLDLTRTVHPRVFYLPEPFRLVIDLSVESPEKMSKPREIRRVVLDPGHGGSDPGAIGPNGLREKDVTLDIAHRAAPLLAREVGVSTLLTRDVDVYVPLDERAAKANAFHADLFISIHLNSSENPDTRGVMTFVLDSSRDEAAAKVAARENASTEAAAAELANALSRIESADRRAASEMFARLLQRATGASLRQHYEGVEDHGVRRAGFYVLAGAAMPAVLYEGSFISHPVEARRLNSEPYRQRLADAIVNAVRAYREGL